MKTNRRALIVALENEYNDGTTTPEAASDAVLAREISTTPLAGNNIDRTFVRPYYGNSPQAPGEKHVQVQVEVEFNTSGEPGTPPPWGKMLRACGWSEVIVEGESVTYSPVSENEDSCVFFAHMDGNLHKGRGAHGTPEFTLNGNGIPVIKFTLYGLISPVTAAELPNVTLTQWKKALVVNSTNTELMNLMGVQAAFSQFSLNMSGQVEHMAEIVGGADIEITGRGPSGTLQIEDPGVGVKDYFAVHQNAETGLLEVTHGKTPGYIIEMNMPAIGIDAPTYADVKGKQMLGINYMPQPIDGNDEVTIVVK
ncbi:phage tail tube protein [Vreelandella venusta]|uniref:phage tail tube protein n=1 Tax=Vreelandella venusta TaxID=44935 RepID=UPI0035568514